MTAPESAVAARLGYRFVDRALLARALTHPSAGEDHNERLEFLGDAVLDALVAEMLYRRFPGAREGELTRMRAGLVRRQALAEAARTLDLGGELNLGAGERKSGGRERESTLANAFEAIVGAVFLDGGMGAARNAFIPLFERRLDEDAEAATGKDPKSRLQEYLQSQGMPLPEYEVIDASGAAHQPQFLVQCRLQAHGQAVRGGGTSRRLAEQEAASKALDLITTGT